jgi:hypothetical protein
MVKLGSWVLLFAFSLATPSAVMAHDVFQDVLKEQYMLKTFSCKACHQDKDKKVRTKFADRIYVLLKDKGYSAKFATAQATDDAAKAKDPKSVGKGKGAVHDLEQEMAVEFKKAFMVVAKQSMTIDDMLKEGLFNGARLDTKKIEAAAAKAAERAAAGGADSAATKEN